MRKLESHSIHRRTETAKPIYIFYKREEEIHAKNILSSLWTNILVPTPIGVSRQRHKLSSRYRTRRYCFKTCVYFIRSIIYHRVHLFTQLQFKRLSIYASFYFV